MANAKERLIVGLYALMYPLQFFGVDTQRFAIRLLLTFDYVEQLASRQIANQKVVGNLHKPYAFHYLDSIYNEKIAINKTISLVTIPYRNVDRLVIVVLLIAMVVWVSGQVLP